MTVAADDDDDDFFAEFDVDLDMDVDSAPPKAALRTIPEKSDDIGINAGAAAADDESAVEASSVPMATDQSISEPAVADAAPQAADRANIQPGLQFHHAHYSVQLGLSIKLFVACKAAAADIYFDPASSAADMQVMVKPV